jgi:hypothetical protein
MSGSEDRKAQRAERKEQKYRELRKDSVFRGVLTVIGAVIFYIVIPLAIIQLGLPRITEYVPDTSGIEALFRRWIIAGIPIIIVAYPRMYYGLGSTRRMAAWAVFIGLTIFWALYIMNFGNLADLASINIDGQVINISMVLSGALVLTVIYRLIDLVIAFADYQDNKEAYLRDKGLPGDSPAEEAIEES